MSIHDSAVGGRIFSFTYFEVINVPMNIRKIVNPSLRGLVTPQTLCLPPSPPPLPPPPPRPPSTNRPPLPRSRPTVSSEIWRSFQESAFLSRKMAGRRGWVAAARPGMTQGSRSCLASLRGLSLSPAGLLPEPGASRKAAAAQHLAARRQQHYPRPRREQHYAYGEKDSGRMSQTRTCVPRLINTPVLPRATWAPVASSPTSARAGAAHGTGRWRGLSPGQCTKDRSATLVVRNIQLRGHQP